MTTIHRVNLSEDAFFLISCIFGMWQGTEMSFDTSSRKVLSEEDGYKIYAEFGRAIDHRFGEELTPRFALAFEELITQFKMRPTP